MPLESARLSRTNTTLTPLMEAGGRFRVQSQNWLFEAGYILQSLLLSHQWKIK
jgi:hypothetical protein